MGDSDPSRNDGAGFLGLDPGGSMGRRLDGAATDAVRSRSTELGRTAGVFRGPHPSGSRVSGRGRTGRHVAGLFVSGHPQHRISTHGSLCRGSCWRVAGGLSRGPGATVFLKLLGRPPRGGTRPSIHLLKAGCPHPALLGRTPRGGTWPSIHGLKAGCPHPAWVGQQPRGGMRPTDGRRQRRGAGGDDLRVFRSGCGPGSRRRRRRVASRGGGGPGRVWGPAQVDSQGAGS